MEQLEDLFSAHRGKHAETLSELRERMFTEIGRVATAWRKQANERNGGETMFGN